MPVYHNHKLIHIHIPKTAGTAIESFFHRIGDMQWSPESWVGQEKMNGRWYEYQHLSLTELRTQSDSTFPGFKSFAVVRDPYTRLISDFAWRQQIKSNYPSSPTQFFDSFDDFLHAIPKNINTHWSEHIHRADQKWANFLIHVRPQYQFILDSEGNSLIDKIIMFENIDRDLAPFLKPFGLHVDNISAPHIRKIYECLSREQIGLIDEIYAGDFEFFSYPRA